MQGFLDYVKETFAHFGPIQTRKMFGGYGIFHQGLMFALISDEQLYLKVDNQSKQLFTELDLSPFTYIKQNKPVQLSYFAAPETVFEDEQEALYWANQAFQASLRQKK